MSIRGEKPKPGTIIFVGTGPGGPDLLTVRARRFLTHAAYVFADSTIPESVLELAGSERELPIDRYRRPHKDINALDDQPEVEPEPLPEVPPAKIRIVSGEPSSIAKMLATQARTGVDVIRLVYGDPLTTDGIVSEISSLSRTNLSIEVVPGLAAPVSVPTYTGVPLGGTYTVADIRTNPDWDTLATIPLPLVIQTTPSQLTSSVRSLLSHGLAANTPCVVTRLGSTRMQRSVQGTLGEFTTVSMISPLNHAPNGAEAIAPPNEPLIMTLGKPVMNRTKFNWWESRALSGWTILVPRTKDQAEDMSLQLISHGARPVEVPTISVEPPRSPAQMERSVKGLVDGRYQWVIFTSVNAVKAVWEKFAEFGLDARAFSGVKIACIGQATAERVRSFGVHPELVPQGEQSSRGLLEEFPDYDEIFDPVNRILLPRADIATETLAEGLRQRGWEIEDVTAYRTVRAAPPPASIREMIKSGGFDAVCFTSSSTVRNLVGIAGKPHTRTIVACIGPKTAETAEEFGLRVDVQPPIAAIVPLVDSLAEHVARLRAEGALPPPRKRSRRR